MEIARIPEELHAQVGRLWSVCFGSRQQSYWDLFLNAHPDLLHFGAFTGSEVLAVVGMHDFEIRLADKWLPCGGIAGVASEPGRRGQGLVRQVLSCALRHLHERQVPLAILGTGIPVFYERMGFATTDWHYEFEAETQSLAKFKDIGCGANFRMIAPEDFALCARVHERWSMNCPLAVRRSEARWRRLALRQDKPLQFFLHEDGYVIVDLKACESENKLVVSEWVHISEQSYYDGLVLFSCLTGQYKTAHWLDCDLEHLFYRGMLSDYPTITATPGLMSRAVHLQSLAAALGQSLDGVSIADPLGISAAPDRGGLSPGQLVQLVTGFWQRLPPDWPLQLAGIAGKRAFTCERF